MASFCFEIYIFLLDDWFFIMLINAGKSDLKCMFLYTCIDREAHLEFHENTGIYIMQNTMLGGGGGEREAGKKKKKKNKGKKMKKGEKSEENYIKTEKRALKMHLFGL